MLSPIASNSWFSILTNQQVRRGVYHDVTELTNAIEYFIKHYNERAQPFVWTKTPERIIAQGDQTTSHFRRSAALACPSSCRYMTRFLRGAIEGPAVVECKHELIRAALSQPLPSTT